MIREVKKDPLLRNTLVKISMIIIIGIMVLNVFHIIQMNLIYKKNIYITNQVIGGLIDKYPGEDTIIIDAIKDSNNSLKLKGEELLRKYGYENKTIFSDNNIKTYAYKSILVFLVLSIIMIIFNITIIKKLFVRITDLIESIYNYINNFMDNNYEVNTDEEKEGLFIKIISRLNDLGKKLSIEINKLNLEKENLKYLVTDISHQLKTPLASLQLYNSILMEEDISNKDRKDFLIRNEASIKKLRNLIDSLVNISRLESGMININPELKSIKSTIVKAINGTYAKALDKNISINMDEFEDIKVYQDEKWTEEAIFNVLDNAIKYTEIGGNIDINISSTINYLRIDIKDNGIGIDKDEVNKLFQRFYRANNDVVKNVEGSGVGLYLSRKILETQGGNIICSKNIDKGSTFSLLLQKCNN